MNRRPLTVTIIACLYFLVGILPIAYQFAQWRPGQALPQDSLWVIPINAVAIVCAAFMFLGRNWARWLAIVWIAFHVAIGFLNGWQQAVVHAAFLALFAWFLFASDANAYFRSAKAGGV